jgi:hypothetical protein
MNKTVRRVKGNTRKYDEGGNIIIRVDGGSKILVLLASVQHVSANSVHRKKVNVYLSSLMMKVPDHVYVLG